MDRQPSERDQDTSTDLAAGEQPQQPAALYCLSLPTNFHSPSQLYKDYTENTHKMHSPYPKVSTYADLQNPA